MSTLNTAIFQSITGGDNQLVAVVVGAATILATAAVCYALTSKDQEHEFPNLRGVQFYHAWNFFQRRYDFIQSNLQRNPGKSFSFNVHHNKIIVLTGEEARKSFYSNVRFSLHHGYTILGGISPVSTDSKEFEAEDKDITLFNKKLNKLLNKNRLQSILATLLQDIIAKADNWGIGGESGRIDPFVEIYDLIFVMNARIATCDELTKNEVDLKKIRELLLAHHTGNTPASVLLPWLPNSARKQKKEATTRLTAMIYAYVEKRRHSEPTGDAIDIMIADGHATERIVGEIVGIFFVAISNTGVVSCWMLIHLVIHPEWRKKCEEEIQDLISRHFDGSPSSATLYEKLKSIPISAWEDEIPILDACIRETQRISLSVIALRRNMGQDVNIYGRVVKRGDFLLYPSSDANMNPEYYPEPEKYDPGRWLRPDPVPDAAYPFVGWGAGRHPCTGTKAAKLEMKLVLAFFLTRYEYELVDEDGRYPNPLPVQDMNDSYEARPRGATYYLKYKRVAR
ncbi:cytochrome P450 [Thelephora terrestris]|uniref:Cytochrome P450 n=1 Tax=Thelephora terrestris TaxID=56493 RepID=A0A9P6LAM7_9AGAM|nr:cytochrome P450 [Thelephora terrestris]